MGISDVTGLWRKRRSEVLEISYHVGTSLEFDVDYLGGGVLPPVELLR